MSKHGGKEARDTRLLAEVQVGMANSCGLDLDQNLILPQLLINLDWLKLPWSSWLRNNEGVSKHLEGQYSGLIVV